MSASSNRCDEKLSPLLVTKSSHLYLHVTVAAQAFSFVQEVVKIEGGDEMELPFFDEASHFHDTFIRIIRVDLAGLNLLVEERQAIS